jgi:hypothetical protein
MMPLQFGNFPVPWHRSLPSVEKTLLVLEYHKFNVGGLFENGLPKKINKKRTRSKLY